MDCSPLGFSVLGILQTRMLDWFVISSSRGSCRPRDRTCVSCIGRKILYPLSHRGRPFPTMLLYKYRHVELGQTLTLSDTQRQLEMPTAPVWVHASGDENLKGRQASRPWVNNIFFMALNRLTEKSRNSRWACYK